MIDLRDRFRELDRIVIPHLEDELLRPRIERRPDSRRLRTVGLALVIALTGFALTIRAFGEAVPAATPNPVAATNGVLVFLVSRQGTYQINPDGTGERELFPPEPVHHSQIAWSPDGARIAYVNYLVDHYGIYVAGADGGDVRQLTDGVNDGWPTWSPDGRRIAFASSRADPSVDGCIAGGYTLCPADIYVMNADGTGISRLTDDPAPEYAAVWSPGGTKIAFVKAVDGRTDIFLMNADGSGMTRLTNDPGWTDRPTWSPDGSQIAFWGEGQLGTAIHVMDVDGTNRRLILDGVSDTSIGLAWSPDGAYIAFTSNMLDVPVWALYLMRVDGSEIRRLSGDDLSGYGVGEDIAWQPILRPVESPAPTESPPSDGRPLNPRVAETIQVGAFPRAIAVGEGAVWATVDNATGGPEDHLLLKIDPVTNETVETIPMPEVGDIAVGSGALWMTSWQGGEGVLLRIDPATTEVDATIPLGSNASNVAFGFDAVWVTISSDRAGPAGDVLRIDPESNEIVARISIDGGWSREFVVGEGSVWVYGHSKLAEHGWVASSLWRIDPLTNEVVATVLDQTGFLGDGSYLPDNVAVGGGWLWAASNRGKGLRIDPTTGAFTTFEPPDGGFAWPFLAYEGNIFFGLDPVRILDTDTLEVVASVALDSQVADAVLDPATGTLWIANYEHSVTRIDLN